jgi:hypothetical protein
MNGIWEAKYGENSSQMFLGMKEIADGTFFRKSPNYVSSLFGD